MADRRSELEADLLEEADSFDGNGRPGDRATAALLRRAAGALGEARRALGQAEAFWHRWEMRETHGTPAFLVLTRAALAKLGGDHGDESKRVEEG